MITIQVPDDLLVTAIKTMAESNGYKVRYPNVNTLQLVPANVSRIDEDVSIDQVAKRNECGCL